MTCKIKPFLDQGKDMMGLFGAAYWWERGVEKGPPLWNLPHISCNDEIWHSYTSPKEDPKNI